MSGNFPTFVRISGAIWRAFACTGRVISRVWKSVAIIVLLFIAASRISSYYEFKYLNLSQPFWNGEEYRSDKNPYLHYENAIRFVSREDKITIGDYMYSAKRPTRAELAKALVHVQPALVELRKGARCPAGSLRAPKDENMGEYAYLRELARAATADAKYGSGGMERLLDTVEMGADVSGERDIISLCVGTAIKMIACKPLQQDVADGRLSAAESRAAARRLLRIDTEEKRVSDIMQQEYDAERVLLIKGLWGKLKKGECNPVPSKADMYRTNTWWMGEHGAPSAMDRIEYTVGNTYAKLYTAVPFAKTRLVRIYDRDWKRTVECSALPYSQASDFKNYGQQLAEVSPFALSVPDQMFIPRVVEKRAYSAAIIRGTALMAALHAYKLERGVYPERLTALVDGGYISKLPTDPYTDGKTFLYKRTGSSYLLRSVGPNMKDDHGLHDTPVYKLERNTPGDIVFAPGVDIWAER